MARKGTTTHMQFEPIRLERQDDYLRHLAQCGQIASDYSFINLWGWGEEYGLQWAWQDDLVWIRQQDPQPALWAPVGDWQRIDWPAALAAAKANADRIIRIPEGLIDTLRRNDALSNMVEETREHWDYLYSIEELIELKGNRFHKKKNLLNQFVKSYEYTYLPFGPDMIDHAMAMQEDWCAWRDCEDVETLASENQAIARVLDTAQHLQAITGGSLIVKGIIAAYTIAEIMPDNSLVIHFEKGCPDYKGSYQAINQIFLTKLPKGPTIVNREQDIGDEGLRKAKLSYNPVDFVKKYQIRL
jgi:hypothetical protein